VEAGDDGGDIIFECFELLFEGHPLFIDLLDFHEKVEVEGAGPSFFTVVVDVHDLEVLAVHGEEDIFDLLAAFSFVVDLELTELS
jgi:hypothetical protein